MRGLEAGFSYVGRLDQIEADLLENQMQMSEKSPSFRMAQFKRSSPKAIERARQGLQLLEMTRALQKE